MLFWKHRCSFPPSEMSCTRTRACVLCRFMYMEVVDITSVYLNFFFGTTSSRSRWTCRWCIWLVLLLEDNRGRSGTTLTKNTARLWMKTMRNWIWKNNNQTLSDRLLFINYIFWTFEPAKPEREWFKLTSFPSYQFLNILFLQLSLVVLPNGTNFAVLFSISFGLGQLFGLGLILLAAAIYHRPPVI